MNRVIGIDPGLNVTGWGVIDASGGDCAHVAHGVIRTQPSDRLSTRLRAIRDGVRDIAQAWGATSAAIEASFVGVNAKSALALGQARAAAIIGLTDHGLSVHEYAPNLVKQTVSGYGLGAKGQVAFMVQLQLGLTAEVRPADAADALAVALTHWAHGRQAQLGQI